MTMQITDGSVRVNSNSYRVFNFSYLFEKFSDDKVDQECCVLLGLKGDLVQ